MPGIMYIKLAKLGGSAMGRNILVVEDDHNISDLFICIW